MGRPWYLSSQRASGGLASRSARLPETSDQTGPVLIAWPLLTPWVARARSLRPLPSLSLMNSAVMRWVYLKLAYCAIQSWPC